MRKLRIRETKSLHQSPTACNWQRRYFHVVDLTLESALLGEWIKHVIGQRQLEQFRIEMYSDRYTFGREVTSCVWV